MNGPRRLVPGVQAAYEDRAAGLVRGDCRFFYCAKASAGERQAGLPDGLYNAHPTVKPLALMEWLCRLTATRTKGVVLDPFAGSGTTLLACRNVGRACIGIDLDPGYIAIACERLKGGRAGSP